MGTIIEGPVEVKKISELTAATGGLLTKSIPFDLDPVNPTEKATGEQFNAALLHNELSTKQGGAAGEFYHSTLAENTRLTALEFQVVADVASLPATGNASLVYYAKSENSFHYWDGAAYQGISTGSTPFIFVWPDVG